MIVKKILKFFGFEPLPLFIEVDREVVNATFHFGDNSQFEKTFKASRYYSDLCERVIGNSATELFDEYMRESNKIGLIFINKNNGIPFSKLVRVYLTYGTEKLNVRTK